MPRVSTCGSTRRLASLGAAALRRRERRKSEGSTIPASAQIVKIQHHPCQEPTASSSLRLRVADQIRDRWPAETGGLAPSHRAPRGDVRGPISRILCPARAATISLGSSSRPTSNDLPGRCRGAGRRPCPSLFDLSPGGVCRAELVTKLAVRSYRTISPLPAPLARRLGGIFLLHFP